jgi:hypothetical protein
MGSSIVSHIYYTSACACTRHRRPRSNTTTTSVDLVLGKLPIYGKSPRVWEDFRCMGSLPIYMQSSHTWEVIRIFTDSMLVYSQILQHSHIEKTSHEWDVFRTLEDFPYMGSVPLYGKTSHMWEVFLFERSLPTYGKTPPLYGKSAHIREDFPYMEVSLLRKDPPGIGSFPTCRNIYRRWEVVPCMGRLPIHGK